jgi:isoleucyl-tRNA synthetase
VILRAGDQEVELSPDEIVVEKKAKEGWALAEGDGFLILVNTHLNDDLIREGLVRDLVRIIQNQRREMGLEVTDRIRLAYEASDNMAAAISAHDELLASETLAAEISRSSDLSLPSHIVELGNEVVKLSIIRASSA